MKSFNILFRLVFTVALMLGVGPVTAFAATTPSLGASASYGVLAKTYINNVPGTTVNGDIGFTIGPVAIPAGTHTNYGSGAPYATAGADKTAALAALDSQACTFTFGPGVIDLATDTTHGALGVYTPGVYCISGMVPWANIGAGGITLDGSGTYIFRINGSLTTAPSSHVALTNGASACDVFWTLKDNAIISTLGANSVFNGTLTDTTGLNLQTNVSWTGRAMLFDGIITTVVDDTITVPNTCTPPPPATATLHVVKHVINNDGGTALASTFTLHVMGSGSMGVSDVAGSPAAGVETPGTSYTLAPGTYTVNENAFSGYAATFSGDCDASGNIALIGGDNKTCTITNDDIAVPPPVVPPVFPPVVPPPVVPPPVVPPVVITPVVTPPVVPPVPPVVPPTTVSTPSTPNTGNGGSAPETLLTLLISAILALGSFGLLVHRTR